MNGESKIRLVQTCAACPEQYDAYIGDRFVGYLRLRHGYFRAENAAREIVYEDHPRGDGSFDSADERRVQLNRACDAILKDIAGNGGDPETGEPPEDRYEIGTSPDEEFDE